MSYQIYDNNASIRFVNNGQTLFVMKSSIKAITQVREDMIKIDTGNCFGSIYFRHQDVSEPLTFMPIQLLTYLRYWVSNLQPPGPNQ
jgi:hypothetical protein